MKKYNKYKDSGIEWIGEIPEHWEVKKLKYCIENIETGKREKAASSNDILSIGGEHIGSNGKVIYNNLRYVSRAFFENFKKGKVQENDILMVKDGATIGKTAFVDFDPNNKMLLNEHVYRIVAHKYYYYFFLSNYFQRSIWKENQSSAQEGITLSTILNIFSINIPPLEEQTAIANYLDRKTAEIDELIADKKRLLELYEEEKTAIINQAVTKGINPDLPAEASAQAGVKMKDSGIDWLGEIPEHWEVKKLKYVCKIQGRIGFKGYRSADLVNNGDGAITLGASHISKKNRIDISKPIYLRWEKYFESPEIMVKKNDIVFTQRGAYLGKVGLIDKDYGEVTINPSLILLKNIKVNSEFLSFFLTSNFIKENVSVISSDTAIPMISQHQTANFYCVFPPLKEQTAIVQHIETEINRINAKTEKTKKLIDLLTEYRTALISEVVTGKIKVI